MQLTVLSLLALATGALVAGQSTSGGASTTGGAVTTSRTESNIEITLGYTQIWGTSSYSGCGVLTDRGRVVCYWSGQGFNSPAASYLADAFTEPILRLGLNYVYTAFTTPPTASNDAARFSAYKTAIPTVKPTNDVDQRLFTPISSAINRAMSLQTSSAPGNGSSPGAPGNGSSSGASSSSSKAGASQPTGMALSAVAGVAVGIAGLAIGL